GLELGTATLADELRIGAIRLQPQRNTLFDAGPEAAVAQCVVRPGTGGSSVQPGEIDAGPESATSACHLPFRGACRESMTRNFIIPSQKEYSLVKKPLAIVGVVLLAILASPLLDPLTRARVFTGIFLGGGLAL